LGFLLRSVSALQHLDEGVLRDVDFAEGFHLRFALLLFLEKFALSGDVAAVTLGGHVLAHRGDRFPGDDAASDGGLDGDHEHLLRDHFLELGGELASLGLGFIAVHDDGEGFYRFPGDEHVHFDHVGGAVAGMFVVHGTVSPGHGFEAVVEIDEDVGEGDGGREEDTSVIDGLGILELAPFLHDELHDFTDELARNHDEDPHDGFADLLDDGRIREVARVVDDECFPIRLGDLVDHRGVGGNDIHVEFAAEAFLHDFHVEKAEEAAAEAEAQSGRALGLEGEGRVVDLELAHRELEGLVVGGVDGVDSGKDHRLDLLEAGEGYRAGVITIGDGVADLDLGGRLHVGDDVAHVSRREGIGLGHAGGEDSGLLDLVGSGGVEKFDAVAPFHGSGHAADVGNYAAVGVKDRVKDGGAQESILGVGRRGDEFDDCFEDVLDPDAHFCGSGNGVFTGNGEDVLELFAALIDVGGGEVDLVEDRHDGEALFVGQVDIGHGLGLDALGGIDDEDGSFAGREAAGDLVAEIDVPGGVEEVHLVGLPVLGLVVHRDGMRLDRDSALTLEVHRVEMLCLLHS